MFQAIAGLFARAPITPRHLPRRARPCLESLEGRTLPAAVVIDWQPPPILREDIVLTPRTPANAPTQVTVGQTAAATTIQKAVDLVADGGTVYLEARTYVENIRVVGKSVNIVGILDKTRIQAANPNAAVVTFDQGGGSLQRLRLTGGTGGVSGFRAATGVAGVVLRAVQVSDTRGTGITGRFSALTIESCSVKDVPGAGVNVVAWGEMRISQVIVAGCGGAGIVANNYVGSGELLIRSCDVSNVGDSGIVVRGGARTVLVDFCRVTNAVRAGVEMDGGEEATIRRTHIERTKMTAGDFWGAGILALNTTEVHIDDVWLDMNEQFAILAWAPDRPTRVRLYTVHIIFPKYTVIFGAHGTWNMDPMEGTEHLYCYDQYGNPPDRMHVVTDGLDFPNVY